LLTLFFVSSFPVHQASRRGTGAVPSVWKPYFQFQSHEPGFDFLKSLPIDEKINRIEFSSAVKDGVVLLTTNGTPSSTRPRGSAVSLIR